MSKNAQAVGALLENSKGKILVLLRHKDRPEPNTYGPPGGGVKFLETKEKACAREIYEETGLVVDPSKLEFVKTYNNEWQSAGYNINFYLFRYKLDEQNPRVVLQPDEATSYLWGDPKGLYKRKDLMKGLYIILKDIYKL